MSVKRTKTKEERLLEMLIKDYIDETMYMKMLKRIKNEK